jgi:hypothetical protein
MSHARTTCLIAAAAILAAFMPGSANQPSDRDAVRQAALDYVEGVYEVQPDRIRRSVHPTLVKRGFYKKGASAPYVELTMNFQQLLELARDWNRDGRQDTSVKEVAVLEVLDQTAVAKVTASWGVDYMLLGKYDGRWQIVLIVWQSPPPKA